MRYENKEQEYIINRKYEAIEILKKFHREEADARLDADSICDMEMYMDGLRGDARMSFLFLYNKCLERGIEPEKLNWIDQLAEERLGVCL